MEKIKFKKVVLIAIGILLVAFIAFQLPKYRFGYFVKGPEMKYNHWRSADALKLDSGNILILGCNCHESPFENRYSIKELVIKETPSEIYDLKKNRFIELKLPNNIIYWPKGILLKNDKLLLTHAYNTNGTVKYSDYSEDTGPFPYDSMAIVDLKTMKVEKMIQKKLNKKYKPHWEWTEFTLLNNGKIFITDSGNNAIEIYNQETNTSKLLNTGLKIRPVSAVIPRGKDKALIFGTNNLSYEAYKAINSYWIRDDVLEYDDSTETIKPVGKVLRRKRAAVTKISPNELLIMSGTINTLRISYSDIREIEIYNMDTNSSKIIAQSNYERKARSSHYEIWTAGAPISSRYFLITGGVYGPVPYEAERKSTEIVDIETHQIYKGPDTMHKISGHKMINLNNGNILIIGGNSDIYAKKTQLFKKWKGVQ